MRNIITKYYVQKDYRNPVRVNYSSDVKRAVGLAYIHLENGDYGNIEKRLAATFVEVYDSESGLLYASIKRDVKGDVKIMHKDDLKNAPHMAMGAFAEFL